MTKTAKKAKQEVVNTQEMSADEIALELQEALFFSSEAEKEEVTQEIAKEEEIKQAQEAKQDFNMQKLFESFEIAKDFEKASFNVAKVKQARVFRYIHTEGKYAIPSKADKVVKSYHQIPDTKRVEGNNPALPSYELFMNTGNPYFSKREDVDTVEVSSPTYKSYRDNVYIAHVAFNAICKLGYDATFTVYDLYFNQNDIIGFDLLAKASELKGSTIAMSANISSSKTLYGLLDTLRDLENLGFIYATNEVSGERRAKTTKFKVNKAIIDMYNSIMKSKQE
jgi:hypothetical protein